MGKNEYIIRKLKKERKRSVFYPPLIYIYLHFWYFLSTMCHQILKPTDAPDMINVEASLENKVKCRDNLSLLWQYNTTNLLDKCVKKTRISKRICASQ